MTYKVKIIVEEVGGGSIERNYSYKAGDDLNFTPFIEDMVDTLEKANDPKF